MPVNILLNTKLHMPGLRVDAMMRLRLVEKIEDGIRTGSRLTLISAPPGYGKTSLAVEWLAASNRQYAWVSLDSGDNDGVSFFSYVIAALRKFGDSIGGEAMDLIRDASNVLPDTLMALLINDLAQISEKNILVLDDYHAINNQHIHKAVQTLIERQPPYFHLVLITREDPPLALSRLRARNQITEIRTEDLRFSIEEAEVFLNNTAGQKINPETLKVLLSRTEGWAAGLQLAAISLKSHGEKETLEFVNSFGGSHRYVIDYLVDEVLSSLPRELKEFLLKSSVLDRFCAQMCDLICDTRQSKELLYQLENNNLFLVSLDDKREWFRYHHLFADSLRTLLPEGERGSICLKAAGWLEENGYLQEAVEYALKSKSYREALSLIEKAQAELFRNGQMHRLVRWLEVVPEEILRENEFLTVRKAWALTIVGDIRAAVSFMAALNDEIISGYTSLNKGIVLGLKAMFAEFAENDAVEKLAEEALSLIGDEEPVVSTVTLNTLANARRRTGSIKDAIEASEAAVKSGSVLGNAFANILAVCTAAINLDLSGDRRKAAAVLDGFLKANASVRNKPSPVLGLIYSNLALLEYEANNLERALEYAGLGLDLCNKASITWNSSIEQIMAAIVFTMGDAGKALDIMESAVKTAKSLNLGSVLLRNEAFQMELFIRMGKLERVEKWIKEKGYSAQDKPAFLLEIPYFVHARLLLAQNRFEDAKILLDNLKESIEQAGRNNRLITALLLQTSRCLMVKDKENAAAYFDQAVKLAEAGDYYRAFLDEGFCSNGTLPDFCDKASPFIKKLSEFFTASEARGKRHSVSSVLIEDLSERELELLALIDSGLSNDEISKKLFISKNTTQWHISNIYSKLGVKSRTQAIAMARSLGII